MSRPEPSQLLVLSAEVTLAPEPTVARLERFLGRAIEIRRPEIYRENPFAPLYDLSSSRERLGSSC